MRRALGVIAKGTFEISDLSNWTRHEIPEGTVLWTPDDVEVSSEPSGLMRIYHAEAT